jgi:hypothetical protein
VIPVFDSGNWVADINMLKTLESGFLVRTEECRECELSMVGSMPAFDCVAVKNWDEILDPPTEQPYSSLTTTGRQDWREGVSICLQHRAMLFRIIVAGAMQERLLASKIICEPLMWCNLCLYC